MNSGNKQRLVTRLQSLAAAYDRLIVVVEQVPARGWYTLTVTVHYGSGGPMTALLYGRITQTPSCEGKILAA